MRSESGFVQRLWNLMMLPPGHNSKLQAKDPTENSNDYASCGLLQAVEVSKLVKKAKWNRDAVEKREKRMIKWATSEWGD